MLLFIQSLQNFLANVYENLIPSVQSNSLQQFTFVWVQLNKTHAVFERPNIFWPQNTHLEGCFHQLFYFPWRPLSQYGSNRNRECTNTVWKVGLQTLAVSSPSRSSLPSSAQWAHHGQVTWAVWGAGDQSVWYWDLGQWCILFASQRMFSQLLVAVENHWLHQLFAVWQQKLIDWIFIEFYVRSITQACFAVWEIQVPMNRRGDAGLCLANF